VTDSSLPLQAAVHDFPTFMSLVHETDTHDLWGGAALPANHHLKMIEALTGDFGHTLIVTPRGSGKTSLVQWWVEWRLGRASMQLDEMEKSWANDFRVIYFSNTAHQAYRVSNAIKATIESNVVYQTIFPKVKAHKDKWSQEEWKVRGNTVKDANFQALGVGGPALGSRALLLIFDDIADQENMATAYQRDNLRYWLEHTAEPILVPWGRMVMTATRWAWDDPPAWAEGRSWHKVYMKALVEDESYWPERFPVKWLLEKRSESPKAFARQYQNEVAPEEGLVFERAWFEPRFDYLPNEIRWMLNSWDTAAGQGRNRSYSAGWAAVVTMDWHVYLWRLLRGQVPYPYLKEAIRKLAEDTNATFAIVEKKSSGHQIAQEWAQIFAGRQDPPRLIEWQPFGQKGSPSRQLANEEISDFCRQGRVHLASEYFCRKDGNADWLSDAEREIFSYPEGETDDIVDAMCQMLFWVKQQMLGHQSKLYVRPRLQWGEAPERKILV